jgi:bifunctional non-homologous end joining protein LigD
MSPARRQAGPSRLTAYRKKRDLSRSGEPDAGSVPAAAPGEPRRFVIQKHDATRLHYDLRLEMEGVLRSWAVPKGLPEQPGEKVLAVAVEDHPLEYGDFEGTIPAGNYGAGTVMLWDHGHYLSSQADPGEAFRDGHIDFALAGQKCTGEWTLVRMRGSGQKSRDNWLLIKRHDSHQRAPIKAAGRDRSVKTGRTMEAIAQGNAAPKQKTARKSSVKKAAAPAKPGRRAAPVSAPAKPPSATTRRQSSAVKTRPTFIEPMKARAVTAVPEGEWHLEVKYDGFRALALLSDSEAELWSRNGKPWPDRFGEIREALSQLRCRDAILDGEVVALDAKGRPSFQLLQNESRGGRRPVLRYYLFDLLRLDGDDLMDRPIEERQGALADLLHRAPPELVLSPVFHDTPERLLAEVGRKGLEGIMAKAAGSRYEPGRRSGAWLKCRLAREQEFVIGGFTPPQGARSHLGALLVGYYETGKLRYAGKVGTGFDAHKLEDLKRRFDRLSQTTCPFSDLPSSRRSRFGAGMTAAVMRTVTWLQPKLVAQIKFAEWTSDGLLRQPVFLGLREDKPAREVVREALAES